MKPLTPFEEQCAEALALALADVMLKSIPCLFGEPPEVVVFVTLPIACSPVRLESKAKRRKKDAKRYRRVVREARELLRTEPDAPVPVPGLLATVPFDPGAWHTELRPGAGHELLKMP